MWLDTDLSGGCPQVLYLDSDVIVQGDVVELLDGVREDALCAAHHRKWQRLGGGGVTSLGGAKLQARFLARYGRKLPLQALGFNAGVFVLNLKRWVEGPGCKLAAYSDAPQAVPGCRGALLRKPQPRHALQPRAT